MTWFTNIMSFAKAEATVFLGGWFHFMGNDVQDFSVANSSSCAWHSIKRVELLHDYMPNPNYKTVKFKETE